MKVNFLFIFFIFLISCKKDENNSNSDYPSRNTPCTGTKSTYIDTNLIINYIFNQGTYWIYHDSINNYLDTSNVTGIKKSIFVYTSGPYGPGSGSCDNSVRYAENIKDKFSRHYYYNVSGSRLNIEAPAGPQSSALKYIKTVDTLKIDTITYLNIIKYKYDSSINNDSGYYYLKPKIGIVKSTLYINGQKNTYNLIKYHIQ